MNQNTTFKKKI